MKKSDTIREFHWFLLTDYEKEEELLRKKHKEGYALVSVYIPGIYTFKRCPKEDVIYRMDFQQLDGKQLEDYKKMYRDFGWDYVSEMNDYCYFRKPAAQVTQEEDAEIFSDMESRLDMLKRIMLKKLLPLGVIFLACGLPQMVKLFTRALQGAPVGGFTIFWSLLFSLYVYVFIYSAFGIYRLRKKYSKD